MSNDSIHNLKLEYEDRLERVLSKKNFSDEVKDIIRGMFITIYEEYDNSNMQKTTNENKLKYISDLITNIERNCNSIEITNNLPEFARGVAYIKSGKILLADNLNTEDYPSVLLHELEHLTQNGYYSPYSYIIEPFLRQTLCEGDSIIFAEEILGFRNCDFELINGNYTITFPGYSINSPDYSIYTMLLDLLGKEFMEKWKSEPSTFSNDYIQAIKNKLSDKYGKELSNDFFETLSKTILLQYFLISEGDFQQEVADYFVNKSISLSPKIIEENIKLFDSIISDETDLISSYIDLFNKYQEFIRIDIDKAKATDEIYNLSGRINTYKSILPRITKKHSYFPTVKENITETIFSLNEFNIYMNEKIENLNKARKSSCLLQLLDNSNEKI